MTDASQIWVLADDRPGNVGQCLGVAEALALPFTTKSIAYTRWAALPNLLRGASRLGVQTDSCAQLVAPWPRLVIAAGRRTAPVARWIKKNSGALLVQIMDPGPGGRDDFDLIAIPRHDANTSGTDQSLGTERSLAILGAPHRVTPETLSKAAPQWQPAFAHLPKPWIAASIGGSTRHRPFTPDMGRDLGRQINAFAAQKGGSLLLTTSRRTGAEAQRAILHEITVPHYAHLWGNGGENPYFGFLGLADTVIVTGDSVSMVCEACACPAPVYIFAPPALVIEKHFRLHQNLYQAGLARPLRPDSAADSPWTHAPLNAAKDIADKILAMLPSCKSP